MIFCNLQRQVKGYDTIPDAKAESSAQLYKDGHPGILSTEFDATAEKDTTFKVSYRPPEHPGVRLMGELFDILHHFYHFPAKWSDMKHD